MAQARLTARSSRFNLIGEHDPSDSRPSFRFTIRVRHQHNMFGLIFGHYAITGSFLDIHGHAVFNLQLLMLRSRSTFAPAGEVAMI